MGPRMSAPEKRSTGRSVRVCYVSGTWQLIALCASLREHRERTPRSDHLDTVVVFAGTGAFAALRQTLEDLVPLLAVGDRFVWIDDLMTGLGGVDDREFEARIRITRERIGAGDVAEVWVAYPWAGPDRFLLECYAGAHVILYEDGVFTYTRPWSDAYSRRGSPRETLKFFCRKAAGDSTARVRAFNSGCRLLGDRKRAPSASYLLLGHKLGVPSAHRRIAHIVPSRTLREVLETIPVDSVPRAATAHPRALLLGANLSAWKVIPFEEELALYVSVVSRLANAGYEVWWKDHPRVSQPFHGALQERLPGIPVSRLEVDHTLPLEVVLLKDPFDLLVAGVTAGLFYASLLAPSQMRTATFAEVMRPLLKWPWLDVADLIQAHVPSLDIVLTEAASRSVLRKATT
jgi:hypothetical protein